MSEEIIQSLLEDERLKEYDDIGLHGFTVRSHVLSNHNPESALAVFHYALVVYHQMDRIEYARRMRMWMASGRKALKRGRLLMGYSVSEDGRVSDRPSYFYVEVEPEAHHSKLVQALMVLLSRLRGGVGGKTLDALTEMLRVTASERYNRGAGYEVNIPAGEE